MTMFRSLLTAGLAGALAQAETIDTAAICMAIWALLWLLTSDPLPDAIDRGLEAFARRYRK